jgi:predicted acetyltransferase
MPASLQLCRVTRDNSSNLAEYAREFADAGEPYVVLPQNDPEALLEIIERFEAGRDLPENRVRMTWFWLLRGDRIVASSRLRHELIPVLLLDGGNIGYEVRPSERRRGVARELRRLTRGEARCLGLRRVLLTTEPANLGSIRVIVGNGGVFSDTCVSPNTGRTLNRYWITL